MSVDPLTGSYPMLTPYQFAANRPIDGIDLDGLEFYKANYYKIDLEPAFSLVNQKYTHQLTVKLHFQKLKNGGVLDAIKYRSKNFEQKNLYDGVDKTIDVALEFKDLGISNNSNTGKILTGIGKVKSLIGVVGEFKNTYDLRSEQGQGVSFSIAANLLERDMKRAEWVGNVISSAVNEGVIKGDIDYLKKFSNFTLDGQIPIKDINPTTGIGKMDQSLLLQMKSDFQKLESYVEEDRNNFIKVEKTGGLDNNSNRNSDYVKIREQKFENKPK